jgi:hypothetical protein
VLSPALLLGQIRCRALASYMALAPELTEDFLDRFWLVYFQRIFRWRFSSSLN